VNPNEAAGEGLDGRVAADQGEEVAREGQVARRPQKGAWGPVVAEEHYWDPSKAADAARILAAHPPRDYTVASTIGQPDPDLDQARRLAVTLQIRIDEARHWARRYLPADQRDALLRVLRGDTTSH
jgi:hypothetical protein